MRKMIVTLTCLVILVSGCKSISRLGIQDPRPQRYQHYIYTHRVLPELVFSKPEETLKAFENNGQAFAEDIWEAVGKRAEAKGEKSIDKKGLEFSKEYVNHITVYLIKLPTPVSIAESYFIAVAKKDQTVRYFTLELTIGSMDNRRLDATVLGEWTTDHEHLNYGKGPKPIKEDFIKAVMDNL